MALKAWAESGKVNKLEPKRCSGRVFNSNLGSFATQHSKRLARTRLLLELKTRP
jgi:hypothetical protein